jgi:glycosyltransferase involved in cell wall biosynthesis
LQDLGILDITHIPKHALSYTYCADSMKRLHKLIVILPCFNEASTLPVVLKSIPKTVKAISKITVIVIDDGSADNSVRIARQYGAMIVRHGNNRGLGAAFRTGIDAALTAGADIIVCMDSDGQFTGADIPGLTAPIIHGTADMVTGSRFLKGSTKDGMPSVRILGNKLFTGLVNRLVRSVFTDTQCGFRAYSRNAALGISSYGAFTYTQEVFLNLVSGGFTIQEIPVQVKYFKNRKSRISGSLAEYGIRSLGIIIRTMRDMDPMQFFGIPGILLFSGGAFIGALLVVRYVMFRVTSPYRSLIDVAVAMIVTGTLMFVLALIADMLRIIKTNQERILFHIKKNSLKHSA